MNNIAKAANGVEENETKIIDSFSTDLSKRFQRDAQSLMDYRRWEGLELNCVLILALKMKLLRFVTNCSILT